MNKENVPQLRFPVFDGEWEIKKLGTLSDLITKGTTPKKFVESGIKFIKLECFDGDKINPDKCLFIDEKTHNKELKRSILKENDLLFAIAGATIGKVNIVPENILPANTNQALSIVRLKENKNIGFVYHNLKSDKMRRYILDNISVGAQPNLNLEQMNNFSFYLPTYSEQQKIASFLSEVDEKIQQLTRKATLLEQYKKGIMQQLFSGKLRFKDENGKDYPDWDSIKMNELFSFKQGIQCGVEDQFLEKADNMERFIRIIDLTSDKETQRFIKNIDKGNVLSEDDLFMVRYGVPGLIGFGYNGIIANNLFRLIPKKNVHNKFYLYVLTYLKKDIMNLSSSTTMPALNFRSLGILKIPKIEIREQQKIANFLSDIDNKIEKTSQQIMQTQNFKKGLLQQMFV